MQEEAAIAITMTSMAVLVGWLVWVVSNSRRRTNELNVITEFHNRLLDKLGSAKDLEEFLATEGGQKLLGSLDRELPETGNRTLRALQTGVIVTMAGLAMLILGAVYPHDQGFVAIGVIALAAGFGFIISSILSYKFGDRLAGR